MPRKLEAEARAKRSRPPRVKELRAERWNPTIFVSLMIVIVVLFILIVAVIAYTQ